MVHPRAELITHTCAKEGAPLTALSVRPLPVTARDHKMYPNDIQRQAAWYNLQTAALLVPDASQAKHPHIESPVHMFGIVFRQAKHPHIESPVHMFGIVFRYQSKASVGDLSHSTSLD